MRRKTIFFTVKTPENVGDAHFIRAPKAQDPQCRLRFYECGEGVSLKVVPFR
jgi:hypothetical protein